MVVFRVPGKSCAAYVQPCPAGTAARTPSSLSPYRATSRDLYRYRTRHMGVELLLLPIR